MRKYIKLYACIYNNVGDDLMVDILLKRYPTYTFFYSNQYYEASNKFLKYKNFINLYSVYKKWDILNHLCNKLTFNISKDFIYRYVIRKLEKKCCCSVYIGGSIYMEKAGETVESRLAREELKFQNGPLFIIGSNFGPFSNAQFESSFHEYFVKCSGVCFRDNASYARFSDIEHVSYAPDVVFNYPFLQSASHSNLVIISVVNFHNRLELSQYSNGYDEFIGNVCKWCVRNDKIPILYSFCEFEGDSEAVDGIYNSLDNETREKTRREYYKNLDELIHHFKEASFVLATRFHAMILALRFNIPFFCVSYNQKIENVMNDIGSSRFCLPEQLCQVNIEDIFQNEERLPQLKQYIQQADNQFHYLDRYLSS